MNVKLINAEDVKVGMHILHLGRDGGVWGLVEVTERHGEFNVLIAWDSIASDRRIYSNSHKILVGVPE